MKLIKKYYVNWSYEIELIFVVYLQGDLFLNHIQQRACRCPLFIPKGPLLHLYTINYLTCYINHVSCITSFWFFSFHVKFLKAFLNWFYIVIDLLSWFKSVYCWIFRHQETFDAVKVWKEFPWIPWEGMCLVTQSITSHNICISKFFHFMNKRKRKKKLSPLCAWTFVT